MNTSATARFGPASMGTLITSSAQATVLSYVNHLEQEVSEQGIVNEHLASIWGTPKLQGVNYWVLQNKVGKPWLRIIEDPNSEPVTPLRHHGWLSLEVCVSNVDVLAQRLLNSDFVTIGPPADLDVSDKIRAMQVIGLAGEVLYLTEIKGPVPPFELPSAQCPIDSLFIPVLCCQNREDTLELYEGLALSTGMSFDTKITVVNRAYNYQADQRHPVATLQLAENTLIEIDQIADATPRPQQAGFMPSGIAMISFMVPNLDSLAAEFIAPPKAQTQAPYYGRRVACLIGQSNEMIELIETNLNEPK